MRDFGEPIVTKKPGYNATVRRPPLAEAPEHEEL